MEKKQEKNAIVSIPNELVRGRVSYAVPKKEGGGWRDCITCSRGGGLYLIILYDQKEKGVR